MSYPPTPSFNLEFRIVSVKGGGVDGWVMALISRRGDFPRICLFSSACVKGRANEREDYRKFDSWMKQVIIEFRRTSRDTIEFCFLEV